MGSIDQFGGIFTATAAGTDSTPPVLTVPASTTVEQGSSFDPLTGVSARDNTDGDVTSRIQMVGSVDTTTPGTYALTYVVSDTNGNQAVASRAVTVETPSAPALTPTSVAVADVQANFRSGLKLTATVSPASATGPVQFLIDEDVLCEAVVRRGKVTCTVGVMPEPGTHQVRAFYGGDETHESSYADLTLTVRDPAASRGR